MAALHVLEIIFKSAILGNTKRSTHHSFASILRKMDISYDNGFGKVIQENELADHDFYSKIYSVNGEVNEREYFMNGILMRQEVYVDEKANHELILKQKSCSGVSTIIGERKYIEVFKYEKLFAYDDKGTFMWFSNVIYDDRGNLISTSFSEDKDGKTYDWNGLKKYYADDSIRADDDLFDCHFDESGKLIPIDIDVEELGLGDHDGVWIYDNEEGVQDLMKIFGMKRSLAEFYTSSDIFPWKTEK